MSTTTPTRPGRIDERLIAQARSVSVLRLAEGVTQLHHKSGGEYAGPCPKPSCIARENGFVVHSDGWFFCRRCHTKRDNAIGFVMWLYGDTFNQAVLRLNNGSTHLPAQPVTARPPATQSPVQRVAQTEEWRRRAEEIMGRAKDLLWEREGKAAQDYLGSRGLEEHTWEKFGLGYRLDVPLPGTKGRQRAPAIAIPWRTGEDLVIDAIRYRFLEEHPYEYTYLDSEGKEQKAVGKAKQTTEWRSQFGGRFFGEQGLTRGMEHLRLLGILEGEFNTMSSWQSSHDTGLDSLSMGSESSHLSPEMITLAKKYGEVFAWADKGEVAKKWVDELKAAIPRAQGMQSPFGKDANDLLQDGMLCGFLSMQREFNTQNKEEREALFLDLYGAAMLPLGIDTETTTILQGLATQLGRTADIYQPDQEKWPDFWIAHR